MLMIYVKYDIEDTEFKYVTKITRTNTKATLA